MNDDRLEALGKSLATIDGFDVTFVSEKTLRVESANGICVITTTKRHDSVYDIHIVAGNVTYTNVFDSFGSDLSDTVIGAITGIAIWMADDGIWRN